MKIQICIEPGCKNVQTTRNYCRLHYLKNWRRIRDEDQKRAAAKLNKYVEGICKKYPDRYMEVIRRELRDGHGETLKGADELFSGDAANDLFEELGYRDEDSLERLVSRIKLDREF